MNEALMRDLDHLENKLNFQEFLNSKINLNDLDSSEFDINVFFHKNFAIKEREPQSLNYDKLKDSLEFVLAIQKQTCEEIAVSVDLNLDKYVQISTKFDEMKNSLHNTEEIYARLFRAIASAKDSCQSNMFALEEVLDNYKLFDDIEENLKKLKKYVSRLQKIKESMEAPALEMFDFVEACSSLRELKAFYSDKIKNGIKIRDIAEKNDLLGKTNEVSKQVQGKLEAGFRGFLTEYSAALQAKAKAPAEEIAAVLREEKHAWRKKITLFLMCFSFLEKQSTGEKLVAEVLMKPRFDSYLSQALSNKTNFIAATKKELQEKNLNLQKVPIRHFYDSVVKFINYELQPFLDVTLPNSSWRSRASAPSDEFFVYEAEGYNFVKKVWDLLAQYLNLPEVSFIYGVGLADLFFVNYEVSMEFVTAIKLVLKEQGSPEQLEQLCGLESMKSFVAKWNISTYFHLRYNEIVRGFEQKQSSKLAEVLAGRLPAEETTAPLTQILFGSIEGVFTKGIFLRILADKFMRVAFQLINRFATVLEETLTKVKENQDQGADTGSSQSQRILIFVANDISVCAKNIEDKFMIHVIGALKKKEISVLERENQISFQDVAKNALAEVKKKLLSLALNYLQPSINQVLKQCNENLEPFNGITAKYRMSNKEAPTRPSNFTGNILRPLSTFLQNQKLEEGCQRIVRQGVVSSLLLNYEKLVGGILQSSMKSEELMNKYCEFYVAMRPAVNCLRRIKFLAFSRRFQKIQKQFKLDTVELLGIAEQKFEVSYTLKEINNLL